MSDFLLKDRVVRDRTEDRESIRQTDRWIFYVLIASLILVPLLVGGHITDFVSPHISDKSVLVSGPKGDIFTFYKFLALVVLTVAAVVMFLFKVFFFHYELPKRPILWFILIFGVGIVLSTMFAPFKTLALFGQYNRSDGGLAYLCYLLLMFVAMHIEYPKKAGRYVLFAFYPFIVINFILSLMNFTGHDAMKYAPVQKFMTFLLPEGASLGEGSILLGTLNQWNYMSGMFAVMAVMYLAWAILDKHIGLSILNLVFALMSIATMLMAVSTSGFVTVLGILPILMIIALKSVNKKRSLVLIVSFLILSVPVLHVLASKNPRVWNESVGTFVSNNPYVPKEEPTSSVDGLMNGRLFENRVYAAEQAFALPELPAPNVSGGSGRLYIWSKAMDITMDRPLIGYGLDTMLYHFPQDDIGFRGGMGSKNVLVDKPHNVYIGVAFGTGFIGLIGLIGIVLLSVWKAGESLFRRKELPIFAIVFAVGWVAFLIQALFNDTLPGTAAPMFTLAGMMLAFFNNQYQEQEND